MTYRVTIHRANNREWLWSVNDTGNWRIIGRSSETYHNKQDCIDNFEQLTGMHIDTDQIIYNKELHTDRSSWEVKIEQ